MRVTCPHPIKEVRFQSPSMTTSASKYVKPLSRAVADSFPLHQLRVKCGKVLLFHEWVIVIVLKCRNNLVSSVCAFIFYTFYHDRFFYYCGSWRHLHIPQSEIDSHIWTERERERITKGDQADLQLWQKDPHREIDLSVYVCFIPSTHITDSDTHILHTKYTHTQTH